MKDENLVLHPKKTYRENEIKLRKKLSKLAIQTPLEPGNDKLWDEQHDHKTVLSEIKLRKKLSKLAIQTTLEPENDKLWDEQHEHKTVLKAKSKNMKTAAKKRITRKKTLNKLTSKTPLEPGSPSTVKKNVRPEDYKLLDETDSQSSCKKDVQPEDYKLFDESETDSYNYKFVDETDSQPSFKKAVRTKDYKLWDDDKLWGETDPQPSFILKRLQLPPDCDFHDHNVCIADKLRLDYGVPIPGCYSHYFDEEAMVPLKPSPPPDSDSDLDLDFDSGTLLYPYSWNAFKHELSDDDSPPPPSDRDQMDLESNDPPIDLGAGPMTRSKTKKVEYEKMLAFEANPCEKTKRRLKRLDALGL